MTDTIVVGAGSAGAVIASRMSERADREVLLVEAGPDYPDPAALPADLRDGTRNSLRLHDWGYRHRPTAGQVLFLFPRGKVVGGSSAVNTCIALRGLPQDYDEWAALGLPDWSWEKCLPAFVRLEDDLDFGDQPGHGRGGPIPIRRHHPDELVPWQAGFLEAAGALGFPRSPDHNDGSGAGFGPHAMNKLDGQRMSAARGYLTPAVRRRANLRIRPLTTVRRVRLENRRVVGIEVENGEVLPARRVVLSAGAIASPGILLRSGIGPRAAVARMGAELVSEVPAVGARLLDHPGAAIFLLPRRGIMHLRDPILQTALRTRASGGRFEDYLQLQAGSNMPWPRFTVPLVSLMCHVGKPRGHGRLEFLAPHLPPRIDSCILHDPADRAMAVEGIELCAELARTPAMRDLARFVWPLERSLRSRATIEAEIWRRCDSGYHPCGTVPMGADGDPAAAVDGRGRVRGVDGLIVADASIMPTIPTVNINLPTLMIGERFGEWLRDGAI